MIRHPGPFGLLALLVVAVGVADLGCGPLRTHGTQVLDGGNGPPGDMVSVGAACSSDLHGIVDSNGNVIATCPDDQGCANGVCVAACDAAARSNGTVGCDFVVATPSFHVFDPPPCFAVFLANNWPGNAAITIERDGVSYDAAQYGRVPDGTAKSASWPAIAKTGVAPSNVGVLFLSADPTTPFKCPITPAVASPNGAAVFSAGSPAMSPAPRPQTGIGKAWHIKTTVPVSAYDILPYGGASSFLPAAELLLPTSAWGTNYVAATPAVNITPQFPYAGPGWGQVVAAQDGTTITVTPTIGLPAGVGVAAAPAFTMTSYTLNAGEYIQWQEADDMAGSIISSTKPVSFTGGTGYMCIKALGATMVGGCDSAHQMIPPVTALGSEYVAPPYTTRRADLTDETIPYRLIGTVADTQLKFDPPVTGAPTTLTVGQVVEFQTTGAFTIKSQDAAHPFYIAQYMTGCGSLPGGTRPGDQGTKCLGDEEFVNILPPAQWLSSYVFFTDPTYTTTNLVIVRKANAGAFADVTVDCIGMLTGWKNVADGSQYQITNVDLQRDTPVGTCVNGRHTATSTGAFNVMVWGLAEAASYAYSAGGNVGKINQVVVIN
jgi:hypothetical protein